MQYKRWLKSYHFFCCMSGCHDRAYYGTKCIKFKHSAVPVMVCKANYYVYWPQISLMYIPDWKVCSARARNRPRSFDVLYIFSIKFRQFHPRTLQTFQSGVHL